jgi:hypothetical protein
MEKESQRKREAGGCVRPLVSDISCCVLRPWRVINEPRDLRNIKKSAAEWSERDCLRKNKVFAAEKKFFGA